MKHIISFPREIDLMLVLINAISKSMLVAKTSTSDKTASLDYYSVCIAIRKVHITSYYQKGCACCGTQPVWPQNIDGYFP